MTDVVCSICEKKVSSLECWCIIDTIQKKRYFECKNICMTNPPVLHIQIPKEKEEVREAEVSKEKKEVLEIEVTEWTDAYPKQTIWTWIKEKVGLGKIQYIKVKGL